ncbi:MAG: YjfB family protein [Clostridium beijerinckii]|jgi:hypothetical protein|uniref:YjfB family protein n=1 Tax=Clostridium beijerinckii TaxID=1520 RepID=UPI001493FF19|nr:YjfB family protein [Clostridium beijerinckii]MCI1477710.1 YjfB family protein [Clostridium beijerinckii]MCI1577974.1 YjfB family protein [Clostridium beijerinckii]MCI1583696.1 YjfB family protein [Clostridium beijerinckii]MCI1620615.1 YjfB family protein [Clostridium beijerinckii]NOW87851.1 hypothetical protein [Clostridium beijerinckii]
MDIASLSIGMHQASLESSVQLSVIKMAMNSAEKNSSEMTNIIDSMASEPNKGENIDITV